jgi:hypothetical protein
MQRTLSIASVSLALVSQLTIYYVAQGNLFAQRYSGAASRTELAGAVGMSARRIPVRDDSDLNYKYEAAIVAQPRSLETRWFDGTFMLLKRQDLDHDIRALAATNPVTADYVVATSDGLIQYAVGSVDTTEMVAVRGTLIELTGDMVLRAFNRLVEDSNVRVFSDAVVVEPSLRRITVLSLSPG